MQLSCPICGGELKEQVSGCAKCPMHGGCGMVCCENCGYETVAPKSVIVDFLRRVVARLRKAEHAAS